MRAETKGKHEIRKRFAILFCVAATGVMALGAQMGAQVPDVVSYGTKVTILKDQRTLHGRVRSEGGSKCRVGREVILFRKRPGPDRKLGADRSGPGHGPAFFWAVKVKNREIKGPLYAKVTPKVGDGFVCRGDTSGME
ncbi:MAG TPA: hypothetical protein VI028_00325 [Solirubrobacterales bacterium]